MNLFDAKGYPDIRKILSFGFPFNFIYAGRGIGKTYTSILTAIEDNIEFIYTRRLQAQIDALMNPKLNPFLPVANDNNWELELKPISKDNRQILINGEYKGLTGSLSKMSTLRGFSSESTKLWIHDEFIPESTEAPLRGNEGEAFNNGYETINRNRELKGEPPLQVLCLANANNIGNPIFMEWNLIKIVTKMRLQKKQFYMNKERGIFLIDLFNSPISERKKNTALYKATKGSDFEKMAIENEFVDDSIAIINSRDLRPFRPIVEIADCTLYKHKSENKYYYSEHKSGSPEIYTTAKAHLEKFRKKYFYLWNAYLDGRIEFENKLTSLLFERLW